MNQHVEFPLLSTENEKVVLNDHQVFVFIHKLKQ